MKIILRMVLYLPSQNKKRKNINDFVSGLLVGISIGVNLIGIVLAAKYVAKNKQDSFIWVFYLIIKLYVIILLLKRRTLWFI